MEYPSSNPTIYNLIEKWTQPQQDRRKRKSDPLILKGMTPVPFKNEVGLRSVTPEELLSLRIPVAHRDSDAIKGYQRQIRPGHAYDIGQALREGKEIPPIQVTLDEVGTAFVTDGQHRAVGSIMAGAPLECIVSQRSYSKARQLFVDSDLAIKLTRDHRVLTGTDRMSEYVQDALVVSGHPWHKLISETNKRHKLQPATMHRLVTMYGCDAVGTLTPKLINEVSTRFNPAHADELAELIGIFGEDPSGEFSKKNSLAFKQTNLNALGQAATYIFIRADDVKPAEDRKRWMTHMVRFNWVKFSYITDSKGMSEQLLDHWNKKKTTRRVERRIYRKRR